MKRDKIDIRLKPCLLAYVRKQAAEQNISVSRYIEKVLKAYKLIEENESVLRVSTYSGPEFHKPSLAARNDILAKRFGIPMERAETSPKEEREKECQDCAEFGNSDGPCGLCIEKNYWRKNDELTDRVLEMQHRGYWYKCPVCGKLHGPWEFFHKDLKAGDVLICECGAKLKIPR